MDDMEQMRRKLRPQMVDFDPGCRDLAKKFLPNETRTAEEEYLNVKVLGGWEPRRVRELAIEIQLTIEAYLTIVEGELPDPPTAVN